MFKLNLKLIFFNYKLKYKNNILYLKLILKNLYYLINFMFDLIKI